MLGKSEIQLSSKYNEIEGKECEEDIWGNVNGTVSKHVCFGN
jgi:hypothetical protein